MKSDYVRQIKNRNASLAWLIKTNTDHPLGLVPITTAARVLGVTPNRVHQLIEYEQIRVVEGMPNGTRRDRFIPIEDLIDAPFAMARGRPGVYGPKNRASKRKKQDTEKDYKTSDYSSLGHE